MNLPEFVHSFIFEELSGGLQFLAIVNKASINIHIQVLSERKLLNQLSKYQAE